jgi:flagellar basal body rod protein FlgF
MDKLVHTSLSALRGAMARQAATANNLANVNTVGFRGEMAAAVRCGCGARATRRAPTPPKG